MKKILLIAFALTTIVSNAQYFQHLYGSDPYIGTVFTTGANTTVIGQGHLVGGLHIINQNIMPPPPYSAPYTDFANFQLHVIRTDADGRFTTVNDFNNTYTLTNSAGNVIRLTGGAVIEYSDGSGYGVIGSYFYEPLPRSAGVAFINLDVFGNVVSTQGYVLPNTFPSGVFVTAAKESVSTPGDIFASGNAWVIRIDQTGNLIWGYEYSNSSTDGMDIIDLIESPYASELIVVGKLSSSIVKGLQMVLDPNTGAVVSADEMSSFFGTNEYIHSIDVSNDPSIPGFILSGVVDAKVWVVKTDQTNNYMWAGIYQPASRPITYMYGRDAVGRSKDGDGYEYFVTGPVDQDAYVFKLDQNGDPVNPNALFVYDIGIEETGLDVDVNTSGTADGVTMYAVAEDNAIPTKEVYMVKAYFNGVSGCNENFEDLSRSIAEYFASKQLTITASSMWLETLTLFNTYNALDKEICYSSTVSGGSNALVAPKNPANGANGVVSPNPMQQGTQQALVDVEVENPVDVSVNIYDMLGRNCYNGSFSLVKGQNRLQLQLNNANMAQGAYSVKITGNNVNKTIMLMVK
jgi:hypothetical protein